jgi:hypothetical protein
MLGNLMLPEDLFDELLGSFSLHDSSDEAVGGVFEAIPQSIATDGNAQK